MMFADARPAKWFGRAFVALGQVIWPCDICGTPDWPFRKHTCVGLEWHVLEYEIESALEDEGLGE